MGEEWDTSTHMKSAGLADIHMYSQLKEGIELLQQMVLHLLDCPFRKPMKIEKKKTLCLMLNKIVKILSNYK